MQAQCGLRARRAVELDKAKPVQLACAAACSAQGSVHAPRQLSGTTIGRADTPAAGLQRWPKLVPARRATPGGPESRQGVRVGVRTGNCGPGAGRAVGRDAAPHVGHAARLLKVRDHVGLLRAIWQVLHVYGAPVVLGHARPAQAGRGRLRARPLGRLPAPRLRSAARRQAGAHDPGQTGIALGAWPCPARIL